METGTLDTLWLLGCTALVFLMQVGFLAFEVGNVRAQSVTAVAVKNLIDWVVVSLGFYFIGFGFMFGPTHSGLVGSLLGPIDADADILAHCPTGLSFVLFHTSFATTAATIVSGALAERLRFVNYVVLAAAISLVIYPVFGHWAWGDGLVPEQQTWLSHIGYTDFAGASVVHILGGTLGLVGTIMLGPRIGRFTDSPEGTQVTYNVPWMIVGVLLLSVGWAGFNGGSLLHLDKETPTVLFATAIAGSGGGIAALGHAWFLQGRQDLYQTLSGGLLAGLVAVSASANMITPTSALFVGLVAGVLHNLAYKTIDTFFAIDDPVGVVSVHLVGGTWGAIALAFVADLQQLPHNSRVDQLAVQVVGIAACVAWSSLCGTLTLSALKATFGLRVSARSELEGIELGAEDIEFGPEAPERFAALQEFLDQTQIDDEDIRHSKIYSAQFTPSSPSQTRRAHGAPE